MNPIALYLLLLGVPIGILLLQWRADRQGVWLTREGIRFPTLWGRRFAPWAEITGIGLRPERMLHYIRVGRLGKWPATLREGAFDYLGDPTHAAALLHYFLEHPAAREQLPSVQAGRPCRRPRVPPEELTPYLTAVSHGQNVFILRTLLIVAAIIAAMALWARWLKTRG